MNEYEILNRIKDICTDVFGGKLVGVYVHGSLAFGCFNWSSSDIDFIVVVSDALSQPEKESFISGLLKLDEHCPPKGLEMSVVQSSVCRPFVYPTPYELHFSNAHKEKYKNDLSGYCRTLQGVDKDLAAHFTVINSVGKALCGRAIPEVFAPVPREHYIDSIMDDIGDAETGIFSDPVYFILNLCRVLAYLETGAVFSKRQGGMWAAERLPDEYRPIVKKALEHYGGGIVSFADVPLSNYVNHMLALIKGVSHGNCDKTL